MSRALQAALLAAIQAGTVRPIVFYQGEFSTGTLRLWSGFGSITWNGQTWTGAGQLLTIQAATEVQGVQAVNFSVALNGLSASILSLNIGAARQGLAGTVWLGALDSSGNIVVDPAIVFKGRLDVPDVLDSGETCNISVSYESSLIDLNRPRIRRYTNGDQTISYPTDKGMEFIEQLQNATLAWGGAGPQTVRQ